MQNRQTEQSAMRVRLGHSCLENSGAAVADLAAQLAQPDIGIVIVFAASTHDLAGLARNFAEHFGAVPVIGCTTAGEIGTAGYSVGGLSGVSIHRDDLVFEVGVLDSLSSFDCHDGQLFAHKLRDSLHARVPSLSTDNSFALMLIDGLSVKEESVARAFYDGLVGTRLVGGSAGDGLSFGATHVFFQGRVVSHAALLLVGWTPFPFELFKTQHFAGSRSRLVVTGAIPSERVVTEINGCPAAEEYARAVGVPFDALNRMVFAANPVVVQFGDTEFVRSIQKVNPDGSLTFFCAIDEGIVFRVAQSVSIVEDLQATLDSLVDHLGPLSMVLCCDCILRRIEMKKRGLLDDCGARLKAVNAVGFSTYGEQYCGLHVNQTLTGIAFGPRK